MSSLNCGLRLLSEAAVPMTVALRAVDRSPPFGPLRAAEAGCAPLLSLADEEDEGAVPPRLGLARDIVEDIGRLFVVFVLESPGEGGALSLSRDNALDGGGKKGRLFIVIECGQWAMDDL